MRLKNELGTGTTSHRGALATDLPPEEQAKTGGQHSSSSSMALVHVCNFNTAMEVWQLPCGAVPHAGAIRHSAESSQERSPVVVEKLCARGHVVLGENAHPVVPIHLVVETPPP